VTRDLLLLLVFMFMLVVIFQRLFCKIGHEPFIRPPKISLKLFWKSSTVHKILPSITMKVLTNSSLCILLLYLKLVHTDANIPKDSLRVRGGGFGTALKRVTRSISGRNRNKLSYTKQLEEQISSMNVQIRNAREETRQFRNKIQQAQSRKGSGALTKVLKQSVKELELRVLNLSKEIESLKKSRDMLQKLLDEQTKTMEDLQESSKAKLDDALASAAESEKLVAGLRADVSRWNGEINKLQERHEKEIKRIESEFQSLLTSQEREFKEEAQRIVEAERSNLKREIDDVKANASECIDAEKKKLRKLVKVMAEREKELSRQQRKSQIHLSGEGTKKGSLNKGEVATVRASNK